MSNNDLNNPDGPSTRRTVHSRQRPPLPPPPYYTQQPSPNYQHPPQPYNTGFPVRITGNPVRMPNGDYRNVVVQQNIQRRVSVDVRMPVQTTSAVQSTPQPQRTLTPPPPLLTRQPSPCTPPSTENSGELVPATVQNGERRETIEATGVTSVFKLIDESNNSYKSLGESMSNVNSQLKDNIEKLEKSLQDNIALREQREVQDGVIKELREKVELLNNNIEEIKKKATSEIQQAKSEGNNWENKCVNLNADMKRIKSESVEDQKMVESLTKTVRDKEKMMEELRKKYFSAKSSGDQFKRQLEDKEKEIDSLKKKVIDNEKLIKAQQLQKDELEEKHRNTCESYSKLNDRHKNLGTVSRSLRSKVDDLLKKDSKNLATIQDLETEQNELKKSAEELQAIISERSDENTRISQEFEKERNENQKKALELEEKTKKIQDLTVENQVLVEKTDELGMSMSAAMGKFYDSITSKRSSESGSLPSSQDGNSVESSSSSMAVDENTGNSINSAGNQTDELETQEDVPLGARLGEKRKLPTRKSGIEKKKCADANSSFDQEPSQGKPIIVLPQIPGDPTVTLRQRR